MLGQTIEVRFDKSLSEDSDCRGMSKVRENLIILQIDTEQYRVPDTQLEQTFFHELVHTILDNMNEYKLSKNEKFIEVFSGILHQALTTFEYEDDDKPEIANTV